ncbi:EAL and HDOD domain-containing protein [Herbaspirillum rhizosphaerae]|uniref:EAL and HDOD domain-containing protein n=1 Tax=Herbaspirillum rhizosphaerae TaxID=346179 RepID=UPI00067AA959|nr:EAL domain-containing protein [Herbaspirillum rhizosphaerae]
MAVAALTMDVPDLGAKEFFLARQPILNIEQELIGYELLFRSTAANRATVTDDAAATAAVIEHAAELGLHNVIGTRTAFLNVDAAILMSDVVFVLPKDYVILEILETVELTPPLMRRIETLSEAGYVFAIDDLVEESARTDQLMPFAGIVKVDVLAMPAADIAALSSSLKLKGKKILAEKVETIEQFKLCRAHGFDYYQGYYFARPDVLQGKKLSASCVIIMQILALIIKGANNYEIVRFIKQDVALSLMLLRLVNTPLCGFRRHIASLGQALLVLGDRQLKRWLQILLYANPNNNRNAATSPLMILAATRGKMCELLSQKVQPRRPNKSDTAFMVGVLSLTDALFNLEIADVIGQIGVSIEIREALLSRAGFYGGLLQLVESAENPELLSPAQLSELLNNLQLSAEEFYSVQKEAFEWGDSISENMSADAS